jgi:hypothetical protein
LTATSTNAQHSIHTDVQQQDAVYSFVCCLMARKLEKKEEKETAEAEAAAAAVV